jgi:Protein of unknown function (DUF1592)/Protein of unknown function (DUF1588)/Protein of unknown function (DUF1595)/Protein of unknown function (DUF1585)
MTSSRLAGATTFLAMFLVGCMGRVGDSPTGIGNTTGSSSGAAGSGGSGVTGSSGSGVVTTTGGSGVILSGNGGAGGGATTTTPCTAGVAVTSQVARLTNEQYDRTIRDLLGVTGLTAQGGVTPSLILATDQAGSLTDIAWANYQSVADMIATQVFADATLKKNFMACTPTGDGKTCLHDTIVKFGRKAFRRPLSTDEVAAFDAIVAKGATITPTGAVNEIAQTVLYMFLISPSFLMRAETNDTPGPVTGLYALSSWEVASRLSFLLWGAPPDDTLAAAADAGQLTTPDQILAQAQRMVTSTKAHDKVAAFHRYYMLIGTNTKWDNTNHDPSIFPAFSKAMVPTLQAETERFFDETVFTKNGTFQDLITSPVAYVNSQTAPLYGLSASGFTTDLKETSLSANQRPGFLTRVGFLNAYSAYNRSSPILRGAFITKNILGTKIGSPPPGAEMTMLPTDANLDTNRKQVDAQTSGADCAPCHHSYINPPGFVMENFDSVGTWQTTEKTTGVAIDPAVDMIIDNKTVHFNNVAEMMAAIAASPMAQQRYAERWTSYSYEREGDTLDSCTVADLAGKIAAGGYTIRNLITDLTQTTQFRTRAVGVTP